MDMFVGTIERLMGALLLTGALLVAQQSPSTKAAEGGGRPVVQPVYRLGPGDAFTVSALHAVELSNKAFRVEAGGFTEFPMIGRLRVEGLTINELSAELTKQLKKYYIDPQVSISLTEVRSQPVSVVGAVNTAGIQQLDGRKTLVEVISQAGGLRNDAGPTIRVTRSLKWGRIALPGAQDDASGQFSIADISAQRLLDSRDPAENIVMSPNDIVSVPKADIVYILGEVKKPGGFVLSARSDISVLEALALADGLQPRASAKGCTILRAAAGPGLLRVEEAVNVKSLMTGKAAEVKLRPNDILIVPGSASKNATLRGLEAAIQIGTGVAIFGRK